MGGWRRLTKEQLARRERWVRELLPRVHLATRPNSAYVTEPHVLTVLQHLADGVNEVVMARPLQPFAWLADYLRHACKVAYCIEQDAATLLVIEMHKKRRVIQNALLDTKADEVDSKRLIREIIVQQGALCLPSEELRLTEEDHVFLATETPRHQSQWSVDVSTIPLATCAAVDAVCDGIDKWVERHLLPQRHIEEYADMVMDGVTHALVELEVASPENSAEWMVLHFRRLDKCSENDGRADDTTPNALFFKTNYELMRKIDAIKHDQRGMHVRRERLSEFRDQLEDELAMRQRFVDKLRVANLTTRTHAIMNERQGLRRAERFLMEEDETRWRFLLVSQQRYDAATRLQAAWRCSRDYRIHEAVKATRCHAATVIQRNYFHYLYHRAISLPAWCVPGREVVVAPSVAQKAAISFQFYPKKDFPIGNFKRLDGASKDDMMEICRQDEGCAAFSTDGALKRFVPRKLSQLVAMVEKNDRPLTMQDGIYIKVFPSKNDKVVNTGIITGVPADRFGLITVVLDGTGTVDQVALQKLSDRWKKIRIRRHRKAEKKRKTFVFGGKRIVDSDLLNDVTTRSNANDYEILDEDEDEREMRERRQRRVRVQSNEHEAEDPLLDFVYEDQSTKEVREREPHCTFADEDERREVIAKRKEAYGVVKAHEYEVKKLQSIVRLQCAWRSKRAREAFRQVLQLRAKEKEREKLVSAVHLKNQLKHEQRRDKQKPASVKSGGFFGKWMRR